MSQFNDELTQINFASHFPNRSASTARRPGMGFSAALGGIRTLGGIRAGAVVGTLSCPAGTVKRADYPSARRWTDSREIAMASIRSLIWR
ncbi:MAG: hypothetical protein ABI607_14300 [Betaproteobacteria bacterium]